MEGPICGSCRSLPTTAPLDDVNGLPSELYAEGCVVRSVPAHDSSVFLIEGVSRLELAVVANGIATRWVSLSGHVPSMVELVLGREHLGSANVELEAKELHLPLESAGERLVEGRRKAVRWRAFAQQGGELARSAELVELSEGATALETVEVSLVAPPVLPTPLDPTLGREVTGADHRDPPAAKGRIIVETMLISRRVEISVDGLHLTTASSAGYLRKMQPWTTTANHPAFDGWGDASPQFVAQSGDEETVITIARLGEVELIEINNRGSITTYATADLGPTEDANALANGIPGLDAPTQVVALVRKAELPPETMVLNGTFIDRNVSVVPRPTSKAGDANATAAAVKEWLPGGKSRSLSSKVKVTKRSNLIRIAREVARRSIGPSAPTPAVSLALEVTDRWMTRDGARAVSYRMEPRMPFRGLQAVDTADPLMHVYLCRAGHLAQTLASCPYCSGDTCHACADYVFSCELCLARVCRRCSPSTSQTGHFCPACNALEKIGRRELKQHGWAGIQRGPAVGGSDPRHLVLITVDVGGAVVSCLPQGQPAVRFRPTMTPTGRRRLERAFGNPRLFGPS